MGRFLQVFLMAVLPVMLLGCANAPEQITLAEQALLDNPSPSVLGAVDAVYPTRLQNQIALEAYILENGRSLTDREAALAHAVGVHKANRIRILEVPHIPLRNTVQRLTSGEAISRLSFRMSVIGGLQAGYGVVIDAAYIDQDWLLAHEFAHIHQFEKLGQEGMLRQVLIEHAVLAGKLIPIEREAITLSQNATGIQAPTYRH